MFVSKKKYDTLLAEHQTLKALAVTTIHDANALVEKVNAKGGEEFLDHGILVSPATLRDLVYLCHPDRHNNSKRSTSATQFLLSLHKEPTDD